MTEERLAALLDAGARAVGVALTAAQIEAFLRYRALIERWNSKAGLTALTDPAQSIRLHFVDSLLCLGTPALALATTVIDVGSGAGLPGIPLAIVRPDLRVTLLEPAARKAAFLELAAGDLRLSCAVVAQRAEIAGHLPHLREQFDAAVARAVAPLPVLLEWTLPFVRLRGSAVLLKGPSVAQEISTVAPAAERLGGGKVSAVRAALPGGEQRVIVVVPKESPTPPTFPRKSLRHR